jgi:hypothetical protein
VFVGACVGVCVCGICCVLSVYVCAPEERSNHVDHVRSGADRQGSLVLHLACLRMNFAQLRDDILEQAPPPSPIFSRVLYHKQISLKVHQDMDERS